jgi:hypothetical protein
MFRRRNSLACAQTSNPSDSEQRIYPISVAINEDCWRTCLIVNARSARLGWRHLPCDGTGAVSPGVQDSSSKDEGRLRK